MQFHVFSKCLLLPLLVVVTLTANAQTAPSPSPQDEVLRVTTSLVTVPVTVKDRKGKTLFDLRQQNFHLFEDGVEQQIVYFDGPQEPAKEASRVERPLTVALLLDVSDSTEKKLQAIKDAAIAFIDKLSIKDRVVVMAFDKNVRVISGPDDSRPTLRAAIQALQTGGGTSVYDAVDSITTWLGRISGRKTIVLLTDGVDTTSKQGTYAGTVAAAEHLDATI